MAYGRRKSRRKTPRRRTTSRRAASYGRSRRSYSRRTSSRSGGRAKQQTVRIILENPAPAVPASIPAALAAIPGTQTVVGKKSKF